MTRRLLLALLALMLAACTPAAEPAASPSASPTVDTCERFMLAAGDAQGKGALPPVSVECLQGAEQVRLSALRGPLLVAVWASWCQPCKDEMPILQQFHDKHGERVDVLGYNFLDVTDQAIAAAANWDVGFASLEDPDGVNRTALGVTAPPTTLFIDAQGRVAYRHFGALEDEAEIIALVAEHLGVDLG